MCIISIAGKGTEKNTPEVESFIENGFYSNTAGSGFMYKKEGEKTVGISKGYFKLKPLLDDIRALELGVNDELVVHHRIRTSGRTDDENTHPFVCSSKHDEVITLKGNMNKPCLAHNGMFSVKEYEKLNPDYSDTYAFARYVMGNHNILELCKKDPELFKFVAKDVMSFNKVAILFPDRDLVKLGTFIEDNGYFHSNGGYKSKSWYDYGGYGREEVGPRKKSSGGGANATFGLMGHSTNKSSKNYPVPNLRSSVETYPAVIYGGMYISGEARLDGSKIKINKNNYQQFIYVKKSESNQQFPDRPFTFDSSTWNDYSEVSLTNNLMLPGKKQMYATTEKELHTEFWFRPKPLFNGIYSDFLHIQNTIPKPGKKTIKKLGKLLAKLKVKSLDDKMNFKRTNEILHSMALFTYYDYWRTEYGFLPINRTITISVKSELETTEEKQIVCPFSD